ncbi:hypothetical protein DPMN_143054 [Dreissena polymorpha]|uniref:Uncharacterized protein n=1 Tax=Dreissena polymorpha TaxID=45954 RepID=A0A9D4JNZ8_DREPO|nr:hypothetical protein DPMN_143054 [Dreissena polymorpha]
MLGILASIYSTYVPNQLPTRLILSAATVMGSGITVSADQFGEQTAYTNRERCP